MYPNDSEVINHNGTNGDGTSRTPQEPATATARSDLDHRTSSPRTPDRGKESGSSSSPVGAPIGAQNGKVDDTNQASNSLEEVDNDAEGEEDAEAELLEAVDAAEEALREKPSGANHTEDPDDVDMKIEQEI